MIPYGKQYISQPDIDAVVEVLKSDFLTQGPQVPAFERLVANKVGAKYALALNSATSALHVACKALGLGNGDWLWTSPISFVASANCGLYCEAKVDFIDIDLSTYNICLKSLEQKLLRALVSGTLPKVIVLVHLCGQPCQMKEISKITKQFDVKLIEDASHAIGGKYRDEYIGNCRYSDITVFSFHPVKIITTAEGGMALTNDSELARLISLYGSHGITRDPTEMCDAAHGPWYYEQIELGFNYRMTELQAALGISQLSQLDYFVKQRHNIAAIYNAELRELPIKLPLQHSDSYSAWHLYVILLDINEIGKSHNEIFCDLRSRGIGVNVHYIPIYTQPYYKKLNYKFDLCSNAETYYSCAISLPMFATMTPDQQTKVIKEVKDSLR